MKRPRDRETRGGQTHGSAGSRDEVMDETANEFTLDELREFLEADFVDVHADPAFKEQLRSKLWKLIQMQRGQRGGEGDS